MLKAFHGLFLPCCTTAICDLQSSYEKATAIVEMGQWQYLSRICVQNEQEGLVKSYKYIQGAYAMVLIGHDMSIEARQNADWTLHLRNAW